jgi:hypothetical protein
MRKSASTLGLILALAPGLPAGAGPLGCEALLAGMQGLDGYVVSVPPAGPQDGWCVLDGALLRGDRPGLPDVTVGRLRVRGEGVPLARLEVDLADLRVTPRAGDAAFDAGLRSILRLQRADLRLSLVHDAGAGTVTLAGAVLRLSGGTELVLTAEVAAEAMTPAALALGRVTRAELEWRNDGRLLRPLMESAGARLSGATGDAAVAALRAALAEGLAALPTDALAEGAGPALTRLIAALPQGRGRLRLGLTSAEGIGAARLALAALSEDPVGAAALGRLFAGATITADWQPGIAP